MAVLSFANGKSKQGYWVSFFFIAHFASWTWLKCSSGLSKNFFVLSQRSHVNMKKQRFRSVFYTNLKNPCFLLNKESHIWIHYLSLIVGNLTRSFALLKCWKLRSFTAISTSIPRSLHGHSLKSRTFSDYFSFKQLHIHTY